jgi:hypothetical protein
MARKPSTEAPLSQDTSKITQADTSELIAELQAIALAHPDKVISRNFFRVHSKYAESAWNGAYGTFAEFKRQAGITLSRHAHRLEKDIAKHASKDNQRKMTAEKLSYEGQYLRPDGKRWQTTLVGSDFHDVHCDPFHRRMFIEAAQRIQPEKIVLNGDLFDLPEFGKYAQDPRKYDPVLRIQWVQEFLQDLREAAPVSEVTIVEGNHEFRLIRHLTEATPALMTVLSDLHGFTVADLLGLTEYEVNYVARMDLAAFNERDVREELRKNYVIVHDAVLLHHFPEGSKMGYPGSNGHHHKHLVSSHYSPTFGPYEWHQTGCGHTRSASYCAAEKWSNGFLIVHTDTHTRHSAFEYVDVRDFCMLGGVFHIRDTAEEGVYLLR